MDGWLWRDLHKNDICWRLITHRFVECVCDVVSFTVWLHNASCAVYDYGLVSDVMPYVLVFTFGFFQCHSEISTLYDWPYQWGFAVKTKKTTMKTIIFGIGVYVCCGDGCVRWAYTTYPIWWQRKQSRMAGLYLLILQCAPHTLLHSIIRSQPPSSSFMLKRSIGCLLRQQQTTTTKMWINKNKTSMGCSREHFHAVCMSFMIVPFGEKLLYVSRVEVEALYNPCTALHTCIPQLCANGRHTQTCTMHHICICFRRTADGLAVSTYEATR